MKSAVQMPVKSEAAVLAIALVCTLAFSWLYWSGSHRSDQDFTAFYSAGKIVDMGRSHDLYDYDFQYSIQRNYQHRKFPITYIHPPFEALLFAPLAWLPLRVAYTLWFLLNVALLAATLWRLRPYLPHLRNEAASVVLYVTLFFPLCFALWHGQDSVLLLFLWTAGFLAIKQGRDQRAGMILGLATFKPQYLVPLLLLFLLERRWKFLMGFLQSSAVLFLLSLLLTGWRGLLRFPALIAYLGSLPTRSSYWVPSAMANIRGVIYQLSHTTEQSASLDFLAFLVSAALLMLVLAVLVKHRNSDINLRFAVLVAFTPLISAYVYPQDLTLLLLPILLTLEHWLAFNNLRAFVVGMLPMIALLPLSIFISNAIPVFIGLLLFAVASTFELFHESPIRAAA